MKTLNEILTQIQEDAENFLPDLIETAGLDAFDVFEIGQSRDDSNTAFLVYQDKLTYSYDRNRYDIVIQLQLPSVTIDESSKYIDTVFSWIKDYDLSRIGANMYEQIMVDTWPYANNRTTFVFFDLIILEELDSCD